MSLPLAVAIACLAGWFGWQDVRALADRWLRLRERRLDADLAGEARALAERERVTRDMRAAHLPPDLAAHAESWGDAVAADSVRRRAQELFSSARESAASDDEAWARVRVSLLVESGQTPGEVAA